MTLRLGNTLIAGSGANQDLSNLTSQGQNIANWSSNVSNCITEIPQDIKLELNNGTLTLKAGSKVYVPNGVGVFDVVTTSADRSLTNTSNDTYMVFAKSDGSGLELARLANQTGSGTTTPTSSWWVYYNTSDNKVYRIENGVNKRQVSLPIAIITVSSGAISSIDQVFNGFGYIGSTIFALTGVKSLCPNGKNNDYTNKSNRKIQNNIAITTFQNGITIPNAKLIYRPNTVGDVDLFYVDDWDFNNKTGFIEVGGVPTNEGSIIILGNISINSGSVTKLITKTPFHALDWNNKSDIVSDIFPVGSCYVTIGNTNPNTLLGVGTWSLVTSTIISSVNTSVPVKGTGNSLGLHWSTGQNAYLSGGGNPGLLSSTTTGPYNVYAGSVQTGTAYNSMQGNYGCSVGVTTDATKSGIVGTVTRTSLALYIWKRTA